MTYPGTQRGTRRDRCSLKSLRSDMRWREDRGRPKAAPRSDRAPRGPLHRDLRKTGAEGIANFQNTSRGIGARRARLPYRGNTSHGTKLPVTPHHFVALPESPQPPGVHGSAMAPVTPSPGPSGRAFIVPCAISFVGARGPDSRLIFNCTVVSQ